MKKCVICDEEAQFAIKETKDYYCKDCAEEQFGDVSYLVSFEEQPERNIQNNSEPVEEE